MPAASRRWARQSARQRGEQPPAARLDLSGLQARASRRCRAARAGSSSRSTATLTPIPSTAQPSCGRPSARIPATLARPSPRASTMSFGHLICARSPATSHTASAAISGSSGAGGAPPEGGRSTSDISSALPAAPTSAGPGARARRSARRRSRASRAERRPAPARARGRSSSRCGAGAGADGRDVSRAVTVRSPGVRAQRAAASASRPGAGRRCRARWPRTSAVQTVLAQRLAGDRADRDDPRVRRKRAPSAPGRCEEEAHGRSRREGDVVGGARQRQRSARRAARRRSHTASSTSTSAPLARSASGSTSRASARARDQRAGHADVRRAPRPGPRRRSARARRPRRSRAWRSASRGARPDRRDPRARQRARVAPPAARRANSSSAAFGARHADQVIGGWVERAARGVAACGSTGACTTRAPSSRSRARQAARLRARARDRHRAPGERPRLSPGEPLAQRGHRRRRP